MSGKSMLAAYVAGEAAAFFGEPCTEAGARARAVKRAARPVAPEVLTALRQQNARLAKSAARDVHLAALQTGAAAVVTGQQVGLFLGPLYTLYKAASAIAVSRVLARESGTQVVPVFWLQTEDHDLQEIAHCALPRDGQAPVAFSLPARALARVSVAHEKLPPEIAEQTALLRSELERLPHASEHLERIERAYRPGVGWGEAFAQVLGELSAEEGLLVLDPRDPALAAQAASVHARALREAAGIASALETRCAELSAAGFDPQVYVRPGAPLCFFHPDAAQADRYRLEPCAQGFRCSSQSSAGEHTLEELLALLAREPLRFSTSALLRPILQDSWLPTAAYIGGPGELAYFAQLAPLYAAFGITMPCFVLRARFRILEEKTTRVLARLGIDADAVSRDPVTVAAELSERAAAFPPVELEHTLQARFDEALSATLELTGALRDRLAPAVEKTQATTHMAASKLAQKYREALGQQNESALRDLERVQLALYPGGEPQERVFGYSYYAARYGERAFIERILHALETNDPFDSSPRDLAL